MDFWTLHNLFCYAQTILPGSSFGEGHQAWVRTYLTLHDPDLLAAITDGTIIDRASLCAWWNAKYPHNQHPHPPVRTAEDEAEVARDLARLTGTTVARALPQDAPDYWHTAALDGGAL